MRYFVHTVCTSFTSVSSASSGQLSGIFFNVEKDILSAVRELTFGSKVEEMSLLSRQLKDGILIMSLLVNLRKTKWPL